MKDPKQKKLIYLPFMIIGGILTAIGAMLSGIILIVLSSFDYGLSGGEIIAVMSPTLIIFALGVYLLIVGIIRCTARAKQENQVRQAENPTPSAAANINYPRMSAVCSPNNALLDTLLSAIPSDVRDLLWVEGEHQPGYADAEPSLIVKSDAIDMSVAPLDMMTNIQYYPSYHELTPKQRFIYLNWLTDVCSPVPTGYVFIFYYGLERFLFTDKREKAARMIALLREHHNNHSFQAYSRDALFVAAMQFNIPLYDNLLDDRSNPSLYLLLKGITEHQFTAEDIMMTATKWGFTNTRYIKGLDGSSDVFLMELCESLRAEFGNEAFPVTPEDFAKASSACDCHLANYSLSLDTRFTNLPDIFSNREIASKVAYMLSSAHERTKVKLRQLRSEQSAAAK